MKVVYLLSILIFFSFSNKATASCSIDGKCLEQTQYFVQNTNIPPEIISNIQSQFNGRVISVQPSYDGNTQIQVIMQDHRIIIVTVDSYGSIISVQE